MSDELLRRIETIEARTAVAEVVYGYARAIRRSDPRAAADHFHEDGVFEIRQGKPGAAESALRARLDGREGVFAYLSQGDAAAAALCPVIHNMIVRIHGDVAHAESVLASHQVGGTRITLAEYADELSYRDGAWRLSNRVCTIFA